MLKPYKLLFSALLIGLVALPALVAAEVGTVTKARGEVELTRGADKLEPKRKDPIFAKDSITTGPRGLLVARLIDKTKFVVGNNATMVVNEVNHDGSGKNEKVDVEITKGAFRFVSGLVANKNPDNMKVKLGKLATIGIRGTHVGGVVGEEEVEVMLLDPEDSVGKPTSITVTNEQGTVVINQPGFGTTVMRGKAPSKPAKMSIPVLNCGLFRSN